MTVSRARFRITGRVQGVGFRWFVVRTAQDLGLTGWVRNEPDGSVSCEAQGDSATLAEFAGALRRGPRFGSVSAVQSEDVPVVEESGFEIR